MYLYPCTHIHTHSLACIYTNTYIYTGCRSVNHNLNFFFLEQYILVYIECGRFWYIQVMKHSWKVSAELATHTAHWGAAETWIQGWASPGQEPLGAVLEALGCRAWYCRVSPGLVLLCCSTALCTAGQSLSEAVWVSSAFLSTTGWGGLVISVFFLFFPFFPRHKHKWPQKQQTVSQILKHLWKLDLSFPGRGNWKYF